MRHNEDQLNAEFAQQCPLQLDLLEQSYDSPHTKAFLLLQAHMWGLQLPIHDYGTDLKSVLDQSIRILQSRQTPITEYASSSIQAIHDGRRIFGYSATLS